jgi:ribosomal protein L11 methylase PrmA
MPSLTLLVHGELKSGRQIYSTMDNMKELQEARKKLSNQDKMIKQILNENIKMKAKIKELKRCLVKSKSSEQVNVGLKINNEIIKKLLEDVKGKQSYGLTKIGNHTTIPHKHKNNLKERLDRIKVRIRKVVKDSIAKNRAIKELENKLRTKN